MWCTGVNRPTGLEKKDDRLDLRLKEKEPPDVGAEEEAMVNEKAGGGAWLRKQIESADNDLLREMVKAVVEELMGAAADNVCGALYRQTAPGRTSQRERLFSTGARDGRAGAVMSPPSGGAVEP